MEKRINWKVDAKPFVSGQRSLRHQLRMSIVSHFSYLFDCVEFIQFGILFSIHQLVIFKVCSLQFFSSIFLFNFFFNLFLFFFFYSSTALKFNPMTIAFQMSFENCSNFCDKCWHFCSYFKSKLMHAASSENWWQPFILIETKESKNDS